MYKTSFARLTLVPDAGAEQIVGRERREGELIADFQLPIVDLIRAAASTQTLSRSPSMPTPSLPIGPTNDLVPMKFWRLSGIDKHQFQVRLINIHPALLTQPSVACSVMRDGVVEQILVHAIACPEAYEALTLLARLTGETPRIERYIDIHRAYECLVSNRKVDYSSLRHALAHASTKLTRPQTVRSLQMRFGTVVVDPRKYSHQKEIYRCMGGMLIEIDSALSKLLLAKWRAWTKLSRPTKSRSVGNQIRLFG